MIPVEATDLVIKGKKARAEQTYADSSQAFYSVSFPPLWAKKRSTSPPRTCSPARPLVKPGRPLASSRATSTSAGPASKVAVAVSRSRSPDLGREPWHSGAGATDLSLAEDAEATSVMTKDVGFAGSRHRCTELLDPTQLATPP